MTALRTYQLLLVGTLALFVYILATEVAERYTRLWMAFSDLETRKESASDPEALAIERSQLLVRQKKLKEQLRAQTGCFEQSRTGVLEFVNASATKATVRIESLAPRKPETSTHDQVMGFKLSCIGPVHRVGFFLNQLESGPFSLHVSKLDVSREGAPGSSVKATMEGVVRFAL